MARISVYYDYHHDGSLVPIWQVISFKPGEIDWSKNFIYIPVEAPFQRKSLEDFQNGEMSVTVEMKDLTLNAYKPNTFGIILPNISARLKEFEVDPAEVSNFVLLVADIEELLQVKLYL